MISVVAIRPRRVRSCGISLPYSGRLGKAEKTLCKLLMMNRRSGPQPRLDNILHGG